MRGRANALRLLPAGKQSPQPIGKRRTQPTTGKVRPRRSLREVNGRPEVTQNEFPDDKSSQLPVIGTRQVAFALPYTLKKSFQNMKESTDSHQAGCPRTPKGRTQNVKGLLLYLLLAIVGRRTCTTSPMRASGDAAFLRFSAPRADSEKPDSRSYRTRSGATDCPLPLPPRLQGHQLCPTSYAGRINPMGGGAKLLDSPQLHNCPVTSTPPLISGRQHTLWTCGLAGADAFAAFAIISSNGFPLLQRDLRSSQGSQTLAVLDAVNVFSYLLPALNKHRTHAISPWRSYR